MEGLIKSDIFFVITGVAIIIFTAVLIWAAAYLIKILKDLKEIANTLNKGVKDTDSNMRTFLHRIRHKKLSKDKEE